jgi:hypothetical protein
MGKMPINRRRFLTGVIATALVPASPGSLSEKDFIALTEHWHCIDGHWHCLMTTGPTRALAYSFRQTKEIVAINVLNRGSHNG